MTAASSVIETVVKTVVWTVAPRAATKEVLTVEKMAEKTVVERVGLSVESQA